MEPCLPAHTWHLSLLAAGFAYRAQLPRAVFLLPRAVLGLHAQVSVAPPTAGRYLRLCGETAAPMPDTSSQFPNSPTAGHS